MCTRSEGTKPRSQGGLTREGPPQQPTLAALPPFCLPGPAQTSPLRARQRGPLPAQAPARCAAESWWLQPSVPAWVTPPDPQLLQAGPSPPPSLPWAPSASWLSVFSNPVSIRPQRALPFRPLWDSSLRSYPVQAAQLTVKVRVREHTGSEGLRQQGPRGISDHVGLGFGSVPFEASPQIPSHLL